MPQKTHILSTGEGALRRATVEDVKLALSQPFITDAELAEIQGAEQRNAQDEAMRLQRAQALKVLHDSMRAAPQEAIEHTLDHLRETTALPHLVLPEPTSLKAANRLEALVYAIQDPNIDLNSPLWQGQVTERLVMPDEEELAEIDRYRFTLDAKAAGDRRSAPSIDEAGNVTLDNGEQLVAASAVDKAILKFVGSYLAAPPNLIPSLNDTGALSEIEQERLQRLHVVQEEKLMNARHVVEDMQEVAADFAKTVVKLTANDIPEGEEDRVAQDAADHLIQLEAMRVRIYAMLQNSTREDKREAKHKHHINVARQITKEVIAEALYDESMLLPARHELSAEEDKRGVMCVERFFDVATDLIRDHLKMQIEAPPFHQITDTANVLLESGRADDVVPTKGRLN